MKNRVPAAVSNLVPDKKLQQVTVREDGNTALVKWFDNKPTVMLSVAHRKVPEDECRRWSKKEGAYMSVKRPADIREYNGKMGGVDLCDQMMVYYRMKTRTKKWTIRLMMHFFDLSW